MHGIVTSPPNGLFLVKGTAILFLSLGDGLMAALKSQKVHCTTWLALCVPLKG